MAPQTLLQIALFLLLLVQGVLSCGSPGRLCLMLKGPVSRMAASKVTNPSGRHGPADTA